MTVFDLQNHNRQLHTDALSEITVSAALGCFDGVHLGHAALLKTACDTARQNGSEPAVWTFLTPPFPGRAKQLTGLSEKLTLFAGHGIRYAFLYDFSEVRTLAPETFVRDILIGQCHAAACVCGFNFRFARDAVGTPDVLSSLLSSYGRTLHIQPAVIANGLPISATRIRSLLAAGDTVTAAAFLGRPYSFCLPVVHGKELGRTIGVPTINQNPTADMQIPSAGTYASTVTVDSVAYPAVTNIGIRPSIVGDNHVPNAETHIIGYRGWLYDKPVTVSFRQRLRDEIHFPSLDALREQIASDIRASLDTFSESESSIRSRS
ncbi:MAG: riboflavin biosynthesis protein RibF [Ruminococcaceae bacterium]|nr:riboflavin biosynthesis protein RibF [Oscillospiraceae bacterium]